VEEPAFLFAVDRIVGCVEVQHQFLTASSNPMRRSICRNSNNPPSLETSPPSNLASMQRRSSGANSIRFALQFAIGGVLVEINLSN